MRIAGYHAAGLAACVLAVALASPLPAAAAKASGKQKQAAPQAGGTVDLQSWTENGQLVVVTSLSLLDTVKLPTVVRIPLATGATVQWAGEVLGGAVSADPQRSYKIKKSPVGGEYAEFSVSETRTAQIDCVVPGLSVAGDAVTGSFEWVQSAASPFTSFSVRTPPNSVNVQIKPAPVGAPETNQAGEKLYSSSPLALKPGQTQTVSFSYSALSARTTSTSGSSNTLLIALFAMLVVAIAVAGVLFVRHLQAGGSRQ